MPRKQPAVAYRAARLVDMGIPVQRVASETRAPRALVRDMRNSRGRNAHDPTAPTEAEMVIIQLMGHEGEKVTASGLASRLEISEETAREHLNTMAEKGLILGTDRCDGEPMLVGATAPGGPAGAPRMAARLAAQACGTGYVGGTSPERDAQLMIASVMIDEDTTRIRLSTAAGHAIVAEAQRSDSARGGDWPSSRATYMEFERSVEAGPGTVYNMALEGVLVSPPDSTRYRNVVVLLSRDGLITNHSFNMDPREGRPIPAGSRPAPIDDNNTVGRLIMALLRHVSGPEGRLRPAPTSRAERRRAQRGERDYQWLEVAETG